MKTPIPDWERIMELERDDFDDAFRGAIKNGHPAIVVAWVQAKKLAHFMLASQRRETIEKGKKRILEYKKKYLRTLSNRDEVIIHQILELL